MRGGRELDGTGGSIINAAVRQETRVSPATLFSCHHADALSYLQLFSTPSSRLRGPFATIWNLT